METENKLLNCKIWINNDQNLLRQVEDYAFKQGFGWLQTIYYPGKGSVEKISFKPTNLKNVFALYFLKSDKGNLYLSYKLDYSKTISSNFTHKDRFESYKYNTDSYLSRNQPKRELKEIFIKDIKPTYNLWKLKIQS
jgi:hypothetical protein